MESRLHLDNSKEKTLIKTSEQKSQSSFPDDKDWVSHAKPAQESGLKRKGTQGSTSADSKKPKLEESTTSYLEKQIERQDLGDQRKGELTPKQIEELYESFYDELHEKNEDNKENDTLNYHLTIDRLTKLHNIIEKNLNSLDIKLNENKSDEYLNELRNRTIGLQYDTYELVRYKFFDLVIPFKPLEWMDNPPKNSKLSDRLSELKETTSDYKDLKDAYQKFVEKGEEEKERINKKISTVFGHNKDQDFYDNIKDLKDKGEPLDLNIKLIDAYKEFSRKKEFFEEKLQMPEVSRDLIERGKQMDTIVQRQANKYESEGGMTKRFVKLSQELFCDVSVNLLSKEDGEFKWFNLLKNAKTIEEVDKKNCWRIIINPTYPGSHQREKVNQHPCKCVIDPVSGTIILDQVNRKAHQEWVENHIPKEFTNESWCEFIMKSRKLKKTVWFEYGKKYLEDQKDLPKEPSKKAFLEYIKKKLEDQKGTSAEPFLKYMEKHFEFEKAILEGPSSQDTFLEYMEKHFEFKEERWFKLIMINCKLKEALPKKILPDDWDTYRSKLSKLKEKYSEEAPQRGTSTFVKEHLDLLKETWLQFVKKNNTKLTPEILAMRGGSKESVDDYIEKGLNGLTEDLKQNLEFAEDLGNQPLEKGFPEYMKKCLKSVKPLVENPPNEAYLEYMKHHNLEYDKLPGDFFKAIHASDYLQLAIKRTYDKYRLANPDKEPVPLRKLIIVGVKESLVVQMLHGIGEPNKLKICTEDEGHRVDATPYGAMKKFLERANPKYFSDGVLDKHSIFRTPSGEPCIIWERKKEAE